MTLVWIILFLLVYIQGSHTLSYRILKNRIIQRQKWSLNICCGKTDGGGINADILAHGPLKNLVVVDVYRLPFRDRHFHSILSSHTIEHVSDPETFFKELIRVGGKVTLVVPPLWDVSAALNIFEHKHVFLTLKKIHRRLPPYLPLPGAAMVQKKFGQKIKG